jgi:putative membrane protein
MVKKLSNEAKEAITSAIMEAERKTDAEIAVVVAPASDGYQGCVLLLGLACGSLLAFALWAGKILIFFPSLLIVQFAVIALFAFTPGLRVFCARFASRQVLHKRAAQRAYEEYMAVSQKAPASVPLVMFYISLAEHYAHILPDRLVREQIPDAVWEQVISEFTASMSKAGIENACAQAISHIAKLLAPHFPYMGGANYISDQVIEVKH